VKDRENSAPPVLEFDANGNYVQGWGGPAKGYDWPDENEHGIFVDYRGNVWIGAGGGPDKTVNQILKFTKTGRFLLQIGSRGKSKGSNDVENLNNAADVYVYPKTNEVFVADGYVNRRVIVFDATTGVFKRYWGAYGNKPDDAGERGQNLQQFAIVHHVRVSNDGVVYVALRQDGRVQSFTLAGKFLKEEFLDKDTKDGTGAASIAFSRDPQQKFMYVLDLTQGVVHILNRQTWETVGSFGRSGGNPGEFRIPHNIAGDSHGNLYVTELGVRSDDKWAGRVQKFLYMGLAPR
jgi:DNA-binding beta-propeller fold protein YncE